MMNTETNKLPASLSLDLDNLWTYLKIHGESSWQLYPSYFPTFIPLILKLLQEHELKITFFIVGQDAEFLESKHWLKQIAAGGHEFGNHSFHHEPWMGNRSVEEIHEELSKTHRAIEEATGKSPLGFRGPGFCCNNNLLEAVHRMGYHFDASLFPSVLAPVARIYYMMSMKKASQDEKDKRQALFGKLSNGFKPLKPFHWTLQKGQLLEIPVTTIPLVRFPFHLSYLIWLSQFSVKGALNYFKTALFMCKRFWVEPSILLHPLDFLGREDVPELAFFPGMNLSRERKLEVAHQVFDTLNRECAVMTMSQHASKCVIGKQPLS